MFDTKLNSYYIANVMTDFGQLKVIIAQRQDVYAETGSKRIVAEEYLQALKACIDEVIRSSKSFEEVEIGRNQLYIKIFSARHGISWFTASCSEYFKEIQSITEVDEEAEVLDAYKTLKNEFARKSSRLDVEKILVAAGLTEEDYKDLIEGIVSEDAERSKAMATSMVAMMTKQRDAAVQKTKEDLMDGTGKEGSQRSLLLRSGLWQFGELNFQRAVYAAR